MGAARNDLLRCVGGRFPIDAGLLCSGVREMCLARREVASFSLEKIAHFGTRAA